MQLIILSNQRWYIQQIIVNHLGRSKVQDPKDYIIIGHIHSVTKTDGSRYAA